MNTQNLKLALAKKGIFFKASATDEEIISAAIEHGIIEDVPTPVEPTPVEPTPVEPTPVGPTPVEPTQPVDALTSAINAVIDARLGTQSQQIGETKIKSFIDNAIANVDFCNTVISVNDTKPKKLKQVTHTNFDMVLGAIATGNDAFLYGRSGSGKSTSARLVAESLEMDFYSMGSILTKFEILGTVTKDGYAPSTIREWLANTNGGILCIDEIDASDPRALVNVMSLFDKDGKLSFPDGVTLQRTENHLVIVTANTVGQGANAAYNGRARLDTATRNRFIMIEHDYCSKVEKTLGSKEVVRLCHKVRSVYEKHNITASLISPRTIKQVQSLTAINEQKTKTKLINATLRQGLPENEYIDLMFNESVTSMIREVIGA